MSVEAIGPKPSWFQQIPWLQCGTLVVAVIVGWVNLTNRVNNIETARGERIRLVDDKLADQDRRLQAMSDLPWRMQQVETRSERQTEQFVAAIDALNRNVAALNTRVEVQNNKLDLLVDKLANPRQ